MIVSTMFVARLLIAAPAVLCPQGAAGSEVCEAVDSGPAGPLGADALFGCEHLGMEHASSTSSSMSRRPDSVASGPTSVEPTADPPSSKTAFLSTSAGGRADRPPCSLIGRKRHHRRRRKAICGTHALVLGLMLLSFASGFAAMGGRDSRPSWASSATMRDPPHRSGCGHMYRAGIYERGLFTASACKSWPCLKKLAGLERECGRETGPRIVKVTRQ